MPRGQKSIKAQFGSYVFTNTILKIINLEDILFAFARPKTYSIKSNRSFVELSQFQVKKIFFQAVKRVHCQIMEILGTFSRDDDDVDENEA